MLSRAELRARGREAFKRNYWRCVLVAIILAIVSSGFRSAGSNSSTQSNSLFSQQETGQTNSLFPQADSPITSLEEQYNLPNSFSNYGNMFINQLSSGYLPPFVLMGLSALALIVFLLEVFVFNVVEVGGCRFFTNNSTGGPEKAQFGDLVCGFQGGNYGTVVLTLFLRQLFITLWSLLLIIPGIIKAYEYSMVPYILSDYPGISRKEAFEISKDMMNGNKMSLFLLEFSFIGWYILSALTFNIVGVLYVYPYVHATIAEFYLELKRSMYGSSKSQSAYSDQDYYSSNYNGGFSSSDNYGESSYSNSDNYGESSYSNDDNYGPSSYSNHDNYGAGSYSNDDNYSGSSSDDGWNNTDDDYNVGR